MTHLRDLGASASHPLWQHRSTWHQCFVEQQLAVLVLVMVQQTYCDAYQQSHMPMEHPKYTQPSS